MVKMHTFMGKATLEGVQHMDRQINEFLKIHRVKPLYVTQCFGTERHHGAGEESVIITSVWYEASEEVR
jgi:hypothetical protein